MSSPKRYAVEEEAHSIVRASDGSRCIAAKSWVRKPGRPFTPEPVACRALATVQLGFDFPTCDEHGAREFARLISPQRIGGSTP